VQADSIPEINNMKATIAIFLILNVTQLFPEYDTRTVQVPAVW
jgi:hypothetical protein